MHSPHPAPDQCEQAEQFLSALDPETDLFTFQIFDDDKEREKQNRLAYAKAHGTLRGYRSPYAHIHHGKLSYWRSTLEYWNQQRAGIFVTINETDLKGRCTGNVTRVRAAFVDLDGAPLAPVLTDKVLPSPHIVCESSPGRFHAYWLIDGSLERFTYMQQMLAHHFSGDAAVIDLPRVMRLPGFVHHKDANNPSVTKIVSIDAGLPYNGDEFIAKLEKLTPPEPQPAKQPQPQQTQQGANTAAPSWKQLNNAALQSLGAWVPQLFPDAIPYRDGYRVTSEMLDRDLEEDLSLSPKGIKDFGLHDMGDLDERGKDRKGRRTPIDTVIEHGKKNFREACDWLCERLGLPKIDERPIAREDFHAYLPQHTYIYAPTRELWPAASVNATCPDVALFNSDGTPLLDEGGEQKKIKSSTWLDQNRGVAQMTWCPGMPMVIENQLVSEGGWMAARPGVRTFNLYMPPEIEAGDAHDVRRWHDHGMRIYPDEWAEIVTYLAHRVQRPHDKINHALVLGGAPGIGKDTLLEPVKYGVGPWNFIEVTPSQMMGRFNGYAKAVVLRINEGRDLGEVNRYDFYEHMKLYAAAPPDVLRVDEKNLREHSVFNVCSPIITTNHKENGIYLEATDRRHSVAWSNATKEEFSEAYWDDFWGWYNDGGIWNVVAYLANYDLSRFNPKAPPRKTPAFWAIVNASRAPEDAELADALDKIARSNTGRDEVTDSDWPDVVTITKIISKASNEFSDWLTDRKNRRLIPHRMEQAGYEQVRNPSNNQGHWVINKTRQMVYGKKTLSPADQIRQVEALMRASRGQ